MIPVRVEDINGLVFDGVGAADQAGPSADARIAVAPGATADHVGRIGEPEGPVLVRVKRPQSAVKIDGRIFAARFAVISSDAGEFVFGKRPVDILHLPLPCFLQPDDAERSIAKVFGECSLACLPVLPTRVRGGVLANVVGDQLQHLVGLHRQGGEQQ